MITDKTLDEAIVEALRFVKAAKALRAARKEHRECEATKVAVREASIATSPTPVRPYIPSYPLCVAEHAACKRASLDLTRKLADLRAGR
ncbi:hypothetical protein D3C77_48680 [compost metagenome]